MYKTFEQLIDENQPLVESIAKSVHRRMPPFIRFDDIVACGQLGLTQAARTYQSVEGSSFSTYAYYRIRGAIFDGISRMNWTTRSTYRRIKREQMATDVLEDQSSAETQNTPESSAEWLFDTTSKLAMVYLSTPLGENQSLSDAVEDQQMGAPDEVVENNEMAEKVRCLINELPETERQLIDMTYYQNMSLAEAASKLGKSRSWASRIHGRILEKMATRLGAS